MNKYKALALAFVFSFVSVGSSLMAQEEDEKSSAKAKNEFTLPAAGDIQLAVDVAPIFRYIGNMFNGNTANQSIDHFGGEWVIKDENPVFNSNVSLMGRYMLTDNVAVRANIGVMSIHKNLRAYSRDDRAYFLDNLSEAEVIDHQIINNSGAAFALGAEYRRGYRWIQGIFGADVIYGFSNYNTHFQYGNAITEINQLPSRNFTSYTYPAGANTPDYWTRGYILDHFNKAANQYVGIDARIGVECFFTSYLALGGEVTLTALWQIGAPEYIVHEGFNTLTNKVEQRTETITPGDIKFQFGTQNLGGKLYLAFYF